MGEPNFMGFKVAIQYLKQEPKTGHWIDQDYKLEVYESLYECSCCGSYAFYFDYCPYCGAKMEG